MAGAGGGDRTERPAADAPLPETSDLILRLRHVLLPQDLDCACRETLSGALERFDALERRRLARWRLAEARRHKQRIAALIAFLADLDEVGEGEGDRSVFEEMALLFVEIAHSATAGAEALRRL